MKLIRCYYFNSSTWRSSNLTFDARNEWGGTRRQQANAIDGWPGLARRGRRVPRTWRRGGPASCEARKFGVRSAALSVTAKRQLTIGRFAGTCKTEPRNHGCRNPA
jgi:hypothetical protein